MLLVVLRMPARRAATLLLGTALVLIAGVAAQDIDADGIPDGNESALAAQYAPVLRLHPKEPFYPVAVDYVLGNSQLKRATEEGNRTIDVYPDAESMSLLTDPDDKHYLDNVHGGIRDDGIREHFTAIKEYLEPTVYARVTGRTDGSIAVQYWLYYPFNEGPLNRHEGDWEVVQVILKEGEAVAATYSQHFSGQSADWDDVIMREGHPVVYVALGSHASYFRPYQGVLGLHDDAVSGNGPAFTPDDYEIILLGELGAHEPEQGWLDFAGRWGEWGEYDDALVGRRGPPGPAYGGNAGRWRNSVLWDLRVTKLDPGWLWVTWFVANFTLLFLIYLFLRLAWTFIGVGKAVRARSTFGALRPGPVLAVVGAAIVVVAVPLAWYKLELKVPEGNYSTEGYVTVFRVDGVEGLQMNDPQSNRGLVSLLYLRLPIGLLLVSAFALLVLDCAKATRPRDLQTRLIKSGVERLLIPLVPLLLVVVFLGSILSLSSEVLLDEDVPEAVDDMVESVQSSPLGGRYRGEVAYLGEASLRWGLGIGSIMIIAGGALQLLGGLLLVGSREPPRPSPRGLPRPSLP
jgi:hypothetical protein